MNRGITALQEMALRRQGKLKEVSPKEEAKVKEHFLSLIKSPVKEIVEAAPTESKQLRYQKKNPKKHADAQAKYRLKQKAKK